MRSGDAEGGRDGTVTGAYRAASEALGERPSPSARAAILAAAARAVETRPHDAATGATARSATASKTGALAASRRPLALVASFLVATVALLLVTNVEREQPEEKRAPLANAPAPHDAASQVSNGEPAAVRSTTETGAPEPARSSDASRPNGGRAPGAVPSKPAAVPARRESERAVASVESRRRADEGGATAEGARAAGPPNQDSMAMAKAVERPPAATTAPPDSAPAAATTGVLAMAPPAAAPAPLEPEGAAAANRDKVLADKAVRGVREETAPPTEPALRPAPQPADGPRVRARVQAPVGLQNEAPAAAQLARAGVLPLDAATENDPERWLKRIVALRDAGLDEQADHELARLRGRFPSIEVPPNALRRAGTR